MSERWLPVVGWESSYEVSDVGNVRSVDRIAPNGNGRFYLVPGRMLTPRPQAHGYLCVTLRRGGNIRKNALVHRLVAQAFIPNARSAPNINHVDCNPKNNTFVNLEWCTQAENLTHMARLGRASRHAAGRRPASASLTEAQVRDIRERYAQGGASHAILAEDHGVSKKTVANVINRRTYVDVQ